MTKYILLTILLVILILLSLFTIFLIQSIMLWYIEKKIKKLEEKEKNKKIKFFVNYKLSHFQLKRERIRIYRYIYYRKLGLYTINKKLRLMRETNDEILYTNKEQNSIVDDIYKKRKKQYNYALIFILLSTAFYYGINTLFDYNVNVNVLIFLYTLIGLIIIFKILLGYRIKKGYYGTNYEEARELIYYLSVNNDKNDNNTGKKVYNEIDNDNKVKETLFGKNEELQY